MTNALRFFAAAYLVLDAGLVFSMLAVQPHWPNQAVEYWQWQASQPRSAVLPYVGMVLVVVAWLSALALFLRYPWARWPFAASVAAALLLDTVTAVGLPPQLISGADYALNEFTSVLAGVVAALAFCAPKHGASSAP